MLPELSEVSPRRRKLGLTQAKLAGLSGVSQSIIAKLEGGRITPGYSHAKAIFDALEQEEEKESLCASHVMSTGIESIPWKTLVKDAVALMKRKSISQLPVVQDAKVVGLISESTLAESLSRGDDLALLAKKPVSSVMEAPPPIVGEETALPVLSALLKKNPCVLINKGSRLAGIVTKADLLKTIRK